MRKKFCANKKSFRGFTLIEILIVVAIIAILSSIVLIGIGPTQQLGRDARRVSDLHSIQTALELYYARNGNYPALLSDLTSAIIGANAIPVDPSTKATYGYSPQNGNQSYLLWANLENSNGSAFQGYIPPTGCDNSLNGSPAWKASSTYCLTL